jgi:hypothetical protein
MKGLPRLAFHAHTDKVAGRAFHCTRLLCESVESRRLMSAALPKLPSPPTATVQVAAAHLESANASAFAKYQADLTSAERGSRVTSAEAKRLAGAEGAINVDIAGAGQNAAATQAAVNQVQDVVDTAFWAGKQGVSFWDNEQQTLSNDVNDLGVSASLVSRMIEQMNLTAQQVRLTPKLQNSIAKDRATLERALGPNPDVDLGVDAVDRDPLVVYNNGQVDSFIR